MSNFYLVQLDEARNFFTRVRDGQPYGTAYPSRAAHLSYEAADSLCQQLRERGYRSADVVDRYGQPVTAADLDGVKPARPRPEWPQTLRELALIGPEEFGVLTEDPEFRRFVETLR